MVISQISEGERKLLLDSHPVVTKKYLIITPVIHSVYILIRDRVYMRSTGTFLYASPRMGKSTCAEATKVLLEAEFKRLFIMSFVAETSKKHESAFLIDILQSDKLALPNRANYKELQRILFQHIVSGVEKHGGQQFILIIDELQNLGEIEFLELATLHNRLEKVGVRMTTLGFGQPELLDVRSAFLVTNKQFLIARFLSEPIPFEGCLTIDDLKKILFAYDHEQYYPEDSEYTFTRFFLPQAFENGFRLSLHANSIWSAMREAAPRDSLPMEHLTRTIEFILLAGHKEDSPEFELTITAIRIAVQASNLKAFSGLITSPS